ncbi:MAG: hypothetical protein D6824_07930 [Planctomycetota bacterium]|nr:MAG: hypothetical protein D6824_07930 [Planctomycetota bacterium]
MSRWTLALSKSPANARRLSAIALTAGAILLAGCEADSWFDPSVVGRWEHTPTVVPVLERLDIIEPDDGDFVETSPVSPEDLIPEAVEYEVGPGDQISIEVFDLIQPDLPTQFDRLVDAVGTIDLPQIGRIHVQGLTLDEIREAIRKTLRDKGIIQDALVSVQLTAPRQRTFKIYGAVNQPGRYLIAEPNYRLLDAITEAGGVSPMIRSIRIIRQTPLDEAVQGAPAATPKPSQQPGAQPGGQTDLLKLIEELSHPPTEPPQEPPAKQQPDTGKPPAPAVFSASALHGPSHVAQPDAPHRPSPAVDLIDQPAAAQQPSPPAVELVEDDSQPEDQPGAWMFLNGKWVRVVAGKPSAEQQDQPSSPAAPRQPEQGPSELAPAPGAEHLITQRVIEVPTKPLLEGAARYNVVIRPGDIIYVPPPPQGNIYIGGPGIARPGTYNLPPSGRITLTKAIIAAGGLSPIGIPERVDLTRMVGAALQATVRLDLRAIVEGTEPDVFLKPDDVINVGTNFWAQPLAVIRNGFRMSYGFGFLLDRNFGNDVFGPPPTNFGNPNQ